MASVFSALSPDQRAAHVAGYLAWLKARDGAPDRTGRTLANRERALRAIEGEPVRWNGPVPVTEFERLVRDEPDALAGASDLALWMSVLATSNEGEKYAVDYVLDQQSASVDPDDPMTYIELEEIYHTHHLLYALRALGVEYTVKTPPWFVQLLARVIAWLPPSLRFVVVLAAEVVGTVLFRRLAEKAQDLLGVTSPAGARVAAVLDEILVDELGHVAYCRANLGPTRLWVARQLVRWLAGPMYAATPAIGRLWSPTELAREALALDLDAMPAAVRARAWVGTPAPAAMAR